MSRKRSKNVLSQIDYASIKIKTVEFLPPCYNDDVIFEFPPLHLHAKNSMAKPLQGMDKQFDGHAWTRTITSYIMNDLGLTFRTSSRVGHLTCDNVKCEYPTRIPQTTLVNQTEWERNFTVSFEVNTIPLKCSMVVCSICKVPPLA